MSLPFFARSLNPLVRRSLRLTLTPNCPFPPLVQWVPEIRHHAPDVPFILVGTKADLRGDEEQVARLRAEGKAPQTAADGERLAEQLGAIKFLECSALTQAGLKRVFDESIKVALSRKDASAAKPPKKGKCVLL